MEFIEPVNLVMHLYQIIFYWRLELLDLDSFSRFGSNWDGLKFSFSLQPFLISNSYLNPTLL